MSGGAQRVLRIGRNTADLDRAIEFYCDALGFHVDDAAQSVVPAWTQAPDAAGRRPRAARLLLGDQQLDLTEFADAAPYPAGSTSADLVFQHCAIVVADMDVAHARVIRKGAMPITRGGPQTLPPSTGSVSAFKFRDPDGHPLELIHFPPGTGDPAWQREPTDPKRPTLGIDHSAISVADAARSIAFYALLGLDVATRGVNHGPEQQRLDDLDDVVVDVVALQAPDARTPHVELLGYRTPRGRRSPDARMRDIASDRLVLRMRDLHATAATLSAANMKFARTTDSIDAISSILLRDPDDHCLVLA